MFTQPPKMVHQPIVTFFFTLLYTVRIIVPTGSNPTPEQSPGLLSGFPIGAYSEFAFGV